MRKTGPVDIVVPRDLTEAVELTARGGRPLAGGTDMFVRLRKEMADPPFLVYVGELDSLRVVRATPAGVEVGAAVTHAELLAAPEITAFPILASALATIGGPAIRAMGTLGGNLANASPAGDGLVPLYLLEARVQLVGPGGERELPVEDFIVAPGKTVLEHGELVSSIFLPYPEGEPRAYFRKVGRRRALVIAVASLGALIWLEDGRVERARLALGSLAPTVLRPTQAERALVGRPLTPEAMEPLGEMVSAATQPISDLRASADYRRRVAGQLLVDMALTLAGASPAQTG
ncbi:MAG: FAD binding domain-containing protein [Candidatus Bipolaricaulaceae bacterium]